MEKARLQVKQPKIQPKIIKLAPCSPDPDHTADVFKHPQKGVGSIPGLQFLTIS